LRAAPSQAQAANRTDEASMNHQCGTCMPHQVMPSVLLPSNHCSGTDTSQNRMNRNSAPGLRAAPARAANTPSDIAAACMASVLNTAVAAISSASTPCTLRPAAR
jgi:hypothetical protein